MDVFLNLIVAILLWLCSLIIHIGITTLILMATTWGLLLVYRVLGITWIDGTQYGFINRI